MNAFIFSKVMPKSVVIQVHLHMSPTTIWKVWFWKNFRFVRLILITTIFRFVRLTLITTIFIFVRLTPITTIFWSIFLFIFLIFPLRLAFAFYTGSIVCFFLAFWASMSSAIPTNTISLRRFTAVLTTNFTFTLTEST